MTSIKFPITANASGRFPHESTTQCRAGFGVVGGFWVGHFDYLDEAAPVLGREHKRRRW